MKIPMKEALQELRGERREVPVTRRLAVTRESENAGGSYVRGDVRYQITHAAIFRFRQLVPDDGKALVHAQRVAERTLMKDIYGPLIDELREILFLMYEYDTEGPIKSRLEALLQELAY